MALPNLSVLFRTLDGGDDVQEHRHDVIRPRRERVSEPGVSHADTLLAAQLRAGAPSAFDDVFHRYFAPLVGYVRRFVDSADVAEDLAQDALIHLWQMRASVRPDVSLVPLLRTMVRRAAINRVRDLRTADRVHESLMASADESHVLASTSTSHTGIEHEDIVRLVRAALATLPPRTRLVATMHWLDELGRQEIAEELGVGVRTVDTLLYRAAAKIRQVLRPYVTPF